MTQRQAKTQYCYLEKGQIIEGPEELRYAWRHVSGLNLLSDADLKVKGWLPVDDVAPPSCDGSTQEVVTDYTVNENSVTPVHSVFTYPDMCVTGLWCRVKDSAVVVGPKKLPKHWQGEALWLMAEKEINARGWLKYIDEAPKYDTDTQFLASKDTVGADNVTKTYAITDYDAESLVVLFDSNRLKKQESIRGEAQTLILAKYPLWYQMDCSLGIYPDDVTSEMVDRISSVIAASNTAEAAVDAATTLTDIQLVEPIWPDIT